MASTYGESWTLFHSDTMVPEMGHRPDPSTSFTSSVDGLSGLTSTTSASTTRPNTQSQSSHNPISSDQVILAEIQRLRQELSEIKRLRLSSVPPETPEVTQMSQQGTRLLEMTGLPSDGLHTNNRGPRDSISNTFNLPCCWDTCCNGRAFSNQSNLARHHREKRGEAAKLRCSFCDAVFSRSSARNAHEAEKRCRNNNNNSDDK